MLKKLWWLFPCRVFTSTIELKCSIMKWPQFKDFFVTQNGRQFSYLTMKISLSLFMLIFTPHLLIFLFIISISYMLLALSSRYVEKFHWIACLSTHKRSSRSIMWIWMRKGFKWEGLGRSNEKWKVFKWKLRASQPPPFHSSNKSAELHVCVFNSNEWELWELCLTTNFAYIWISHRILCK